jgi:DNA replication protein DnaC
VAGRLPRRFQGVSFDREPIMSLEREYPYIVREVRHYIRTLSEQLAKGQGIWFTGKTGTGKTTLAMLISKAAMEADHTVAIYSLPRLLAMLRETYAENARFSLNELIDRLCAVELLHIDDVGAQQTSPWVLEQLYTIVNTRYEDGRALLVTTNLVGTDEEHDPLVDGGEDDPSPADASDPDERDHPARRLRQQIGKRTVSRIYEMCGEPFLLFGTDHRMHADWRMPSPASEPGAEPPRWDPFDNSTWEEEQPRYGRPRAQPLD